MDSLAEYDLIIAGGGPSALFTAYQVLKSAKNAGKDFSLLVIAERLNTPCPAGSHVVLELEGMFHKPAQRQDDIARLLREGFKDLEKTIETQNINCRCNKGYEVKARTGDDLKRLMETMVNHGIYPKDSIRENSDRQIFRLPGHDFSFMIEGIGQINMPELMAAIISSINQMGGYIKIGERYISHHQDGDGWIIKTDKASYKTPDKIFMATGAEHNNSLLHNAFQTEVIYTMCCVIGPLTPEDAAHISSKQPMAFCNTELQGDVIWGGIDEKNYLTFGHGIVYEPSIENQEHLYGEIVSGIENYYPGLTTKYKIEKSFGPLLMTKNAMPIVMRGKEYDIAGGWAGMGIVGGYTAAIAFAKWIIDKDENALKVFESLQD